MSRKKGEYPVRYFEINTVVCIQTCHQDQTLAKQVSANHIIISIIINISDKINEGDVMTSAGVKYSDYFCNSRNQLFSYIFK